MQTFNYLIKRFMHSRQPWQAQAIVSQLHAMKQNGIDQEIYVDRLLPVWKVITENLMRHALQAPPAEAGFDLLIPFGLSSASGWRVGHEI